MDSGEIRLEGPSTRRPACNSCKARKTKCDREVPCSACVAASLPCRVTRKPPEAKQRILISDKYTEAIENIEHRLEAISSGIERLLDANDSLKDGNASLSTPLPRSATAHTYQSCEEASVATEDYRDESSLRTQVAHVRDTVQMAYLETESQSGSQITSPSTRILQQLLQDMSNADDVSETDGSSVTTGILSHGVLGFDTIPLPSLDPTLKLLRLIQTNKQRFFVDVPIFTEDEFVRSCRTVYFATEPYSTSTWVIVNAGLFYLFHGLSQKLYVQLSVSAVEIQQHMQTLAANVEQGCAALKLCIEPTMENCKALALLSMYHIKSGRSAVAWYLTSAASRMCLDMGLHRLPNFAGGRDFSERRLLFCIHISDITTPRLYFPVDLPEGSMWLYGSFLDFFIIAGDMHVELFSASAQRDPRRLRAERAKAFATRLYRIQECLSRQGKEEVLVDQMFDGIAQSLDIILHSLLTVVYRVISPTNPIAHPLQCSEECIDSARKASTKLATVGKAMLRANPSRWTMFLNLIISLVPFVSFVALIGNAIARSSTSDFQLFEAVLAVIKPAVETSPAAQKLYGVCAKLYAITELLIARGNVHTKEDRCRVSSSMGESCSDDLHYKSVGANDIGAVSDFPMSQQDWESVMGDFDFDLQNMNPAELAAFVEPYMVS